MLGYVILSNFGTMLKPSHNEPTYMGKPSHTPVPSEVFGMHFFLDGNDDFCSAASFVKGDAYDINTVGYVGEWDDWSGVDFHILFTIHHLCILKQQQEAKVTNH